jgi:D-beta-D-heptose 7-phosphate kinase/D-beta-D-heptose 1-phosphate adenosyltransferase
VAAAAIHIANQHGLVTVADPKGKDFRKYSGVHVLTPNVHELEIATGHSTDNQHERVAAAGQFLLEQLDPRTAVLVTRGASGMMLLRRGLPPLNLPTLARSVFDVTGAGDTVVGALTLALAAQIPIEDALSFATRAASHAVAQSGTVAVTREDMLRAGEDASS